MTADNGDSQCCNLVNSDYNQWGGWENNVANFF